MVKANQDTGRNVSCTNRTNCSSCDGENVGDQLLDDAYVPYFDGWERTIRYSASMVASDKAAAATERSWLHARLHSSSEVRQRV